MVGGAEVNGEGAGARASGGCCLGGETFEGCGATGDGTNPTVPVGSSLQARAVVICRLRSVRFGGPGLKVVDAVPETW